MIPRGHAHGYANVGDERGRLLVMASPPASEERVFLELASMLATGPDGSTELTSALRLLGARPRRFRIRPEGHGEPASIRFDRADPQKVDPRPGVPGLLKGWVQAR